MEIFNPFRDKDFAEYQLKSGKAKQIINLGEQIVYVYPLFKEYTILYTTKKHHALAELAKEHKAIYTLIESNHQQTSPTKTQKKIKEIIPRHTTAIDLTQNEESILKNMHQKGRYNIRLAKKYSLIIQESKDIKSFYNILKKTAKRDNFHINPLHFYESMLNILGPKKKAKLFLAFHPGHPDTPIAGILNTYIKKTATYYYGASDYDFRKFMAPYLLQWHAIQDAKSNGFHTYDFLGIADPTNPKDPLNGVTRFKNKFGGDHIQYTNGKIIPHKKLLYTLLKLKKLIRG